MIRKKFFSIRLKLFMVISLLILGFIIFLLLLTNYFLKPFYIYSQKKSLIEASSQLGELYMRDRDSFFTETTRLERLEGYTITLKTREEDVLYSTFENSPPPQANPGPPRSRPPQEELNTPPHADRLSEAKEGYLFMERFDPFLNGSILDIHTIFSDNLILQLSRPLEPIDKSIQIAIRFIAFAGIISLIAGSIVALIISGIFTQPIKTLTAIANSMSRLDFSNKYLVTTNDEIGSLGSSINSLSNQLNHSISDLQKMNRGLIADIEQKEKIDEMRKEFIFSISHELRTPISLIKGYAEGLIDNIAQDEESKNYYCEVIVDETMKMEKHVQDLLELSHLESGNAPLELTDFNIIQLINKTLMKYERIFQDKNIACSFDTERDIFVTADRVRIEQILVNYLNNAVNHIDGKRLISLSIDKTIYNKVRVKVSNTGCLIPKESIDKIWHSYYKVDKARTRRYGGYGLGLSIVKAIQDQHHNDYGVENAGDRVIFWFEVTPAISSCT